jgi:hypothetical protein
MAFEPSLETRHMYVTMNKIAGVMDKAVQLAGKVFVA